MTSPNPFQRAAHRLFDTKLEFKLFQQQAPDAIRDSVAKQPRFASLESLFSFYVDVPSDDTVQAWFGSRSMFRKDPDGKLAVESGLTLHYSFGGAGDAVVSLYPCHSKIGHPFEKQIHLRIGRFTAHELLSRVPADVADLIAYGHVSSLDGDPTFQEKFRIWLLRKTRPMQMQEGFTKPAMTAFFYKALEYSSKSLLSVAFMSVLKPIGIIVAALILGYLGFTHLAQMIGPK
jgi:hypothetical protein